MNFLNKISKNKSKLKCRHRHGQDSHPKCFNENGTLKNYERNSPKVLLLDIETSPMSVFVWGLYKQRISPDNVITDFSILTWSAKWLFSSEILFDFVTSKEAIEKNDKKIVAEVWKLLDEADIIIAHNANFDIGKLNARFLFYGFPPPSHYRVIDTLSILRRHFDISSNSLDYATNFLGLGNKQHVTFDLWKQCYQGNELAIQEMLEYNKNDVLILEELYVKIRPWITGFNLSVYVDTNEPICPNCLSNNLKWENSYYTNLGKYKAFRCECGAIGRSKENNLEKDKVLLRN